MCLTFWSLCAQCRGYAPFAHKKLCAQWFQHTRNQTNTILEKYKLCAQWTTFLALNYWLTSHFLSCVIGNITIKVITCVCISLISIFLQKYIGKQSNKYYLKLTHNSEKSRIRTLIKMFVNNISIVN
jgi:hypothetical protein